MHSDHVSDVEALNGESKQSRRQFLRNTSAIGVGLGFAAVAQPTFAQVIQTDFTGIKAGEETIVDGDLELFAYVARPIGEQTKLPIVIIASEIFGVHEHIADVARRFAKRGYLAIAPEFFTRAGDPTALGTMAEIMSQIVAKTPDKQVMGDIEAAIKWAGTHGGDQARVGVTGFCWGGRITWLACANLPQVKAGVAWYGRLVGDKSENFPAHPVDLAAQLKAPVLGLYGGKDTGISLETVEQMKKALSAATGNQAAQASKFVIYPDAPHAFHADYRATYQPEPAKDGWEKCLNWFVQHGV
ncbi:dienelactone hydrolase family protein [Zwartia vadi]|uniref:dienelactone hydrolase family protein n=1 Tax=Zwartia vadi TaxID=3058168 RepID=UPI0025B47727|nr:dienelactone hydrolase family protein [Zwartia vadi]MDN3987806.1 dienelactone hydrolase family protein [Zwartia vadi]